MTSVSQAVADKRAADLDALYADHKGDWMQTFTGRRFYPNDPRVEDINIIDIATGLANCCRFAGQCKRFYSVAEHAVLVSQCVPAEHALAALHHDDTEAYLGDVTRPLKHAMKVAEYAGWEKIVERFGVDRGGFFDELTTAYSHMEDATWRCIAEKFKLPFEMHPSIKEADNSVLLAERDVLFDKDAGHWAIVAAPVKVRIRGLDPMAARQLYLTRHQELST